MALPALTSTDAALGWLAEHGVRALTLDSRSVHAGDAFIAWPGHALDGRAFVAQALDAGANACLVEADGVDAFALPLSERIAVVDGLKAATGPLASRFMGEPSAALDVIACTGTNGKTSMAWWAAQALTTLGQRCGVIGTLGVGEPPSAAQAEPDAEFKVEPTGLTTPDPVTLHAAFRRFADAGFTACAIEASSIGLVEHRLAGTHIAVALFSNFTQDHLDFHGSMAAYWQAKRQLFAWPGLRAAVVNTDDAHGAALASELAASTLDVWTYSTRSDARLRARHVGYTARGLRFDVVEGADTQPVATQLIGDYNVSNLLAVIGGLRALGLPLADAAKACAELTPVPGRMQRMPLEARLGADVAHVGLDVVVAHVGPDVVVDYVGPDVVVDYAHTPDALEKALLALQPFAAQRGGALWCVFGCGGNRDAGKRPLMGALAQRLAQHVVITSDNPRLEAPAFILLQIVAGLKGSQERVKVIEDRAKAIAHAVRQADARDVILIAGKGHEDYQDAGGVKRPFSDALHAHAALQQRAGLTA